VPESWLQGRTLFGGATVALGLRAIDPGDHTDALLSLADAWPSPALSLMREPAPASTVSWSVAMVSQPKNVADWFWFESDGTVIECGWVQMSSALYGPDGRLVLCSDQLVAIFG
jgi:acyl-CoA thioesterase